MNEEPCIGHSLVSSEEEMKQMKKLVRLYLVSGRLAVRTQGGSQGMTRLDIRTSFASE